MMRRIWIFFKLKIGAEPERLCIGEYWNVRTFWFFDFFGQNLFWIPKSKVRREFSPNSGLSNGAIKNVKLMRVRAANRARTWYVLNLPKKGIPATLAERNEINVFIYRSTGNDEGNQKMCAELRLMLKQKSYAKYKILHFSAFFSSFSSLVFRVFQSKLVLNSKKWSTPGL